jgi:deazaflavin-dependent oxidoreductase (nitroreductase family)
VIVASFVSPLALLLAPVFLIRFRKRWVAAFNWAVTNRITSRFAARLPGVGILTHLDRKSGRVYRTPVNIFRVPEGFLIALTYARESEWARNVVTAGACRLETCGVQYRPSAPPSCMTLLGDGSPQSRQQLAALHWHVEQVLDEFKSANPTQLKFDYVYKATGKHAFPGTPT